MKQILKTIVSPCLLGLSVSSLFFLSLSNRVKPHETAPAMPDAKEVSSTLLPGKTLAGIQEDIRRKEYEISEDPEDGNLSSPNRAHGLRAIYKPGQLTLQDRLDPDTGNPQLQLINEGIFADGKLLFSPNLQAASTPSQNRLDISHEGFVEQYLNTDEGIRQNFIVQTGPANAIELEVKLRVEGLSVIHGNANSVQFGKTDAQPLLTYNDLKCWDADGTPLEATMFAENDRIALRVNVESARYPVTIDPIITKNTPANADAILESNQTSAYIGYSIAGAGDLNNDGYDDVIVGAEDYDKGQINDGAAFVYLGSAQGINLNSATILDQNVGGADFGQSVSGAGDVNNDGFDDIIVGAPDYSNGQTREGAAFLFLGSSTGISTVAVAMIERNQAEAAVGWSVSSAGDLNNDGYDDVMIGAPNYNKGIANASGVVFLYYGSSAGINVNIPVILGSSIPFQTFGAALSGGGDVNGDGFDDIVVGADGYSNGEQSEGAIFMFHGSVAGIQLNPAITIQGNQALAHLGSSASIGGDVNGDGYDDLIVGAWNYSNGNEHEGVAFVYHGSPFGITQQWNALLERDDSYSDYGSSVAGVGDVNNDGYADVLVSSNYSDGQLSEGGAFLYLGSENGVKNVITSTFESDQASAFMGKVSGAGDVNGDGFDDVLISAPHYGNGQPSEGAVFVFHGHNQSPLPVKLTEFYAKVEEGSLNLSWKTAWETDSDHFEVQKSRDGKKWDAVGVVAASSNSNSESSYQWKDSFPSVGRCFYRLKMIDADHSFTFSRIISIELKKQLLKTRLYPNPVADVLHVDSESSINEVEIFSEKGTRVMLVTDVRGISTLDLHELSPGNYVVNLAGQRYHIIKR
jgi:hypothetical protein